MGAAIQEGKSVEAELKGREEEGYSHNDRPSLDYNNLNLFCVSPGDVASDGSR